MAATYCIVKMTKYSKICTIRVAEHIERVEYEGASKCTVVQNKIILAVRETCTKYLIIFDQIFISFKNT